MIDQASIFGLICAVRQSMRGLQLLSPFHHNRTDALAAETLESLFFRNVFVQISAFFYSTDVTKQNQSSSSSLSAVAVDGLGLKG